MAVDVAGYSAAAEVDDRGAAEAVARVRATIDEAIAPNNGRIFNTAGDGFMIELPAASSGVAAAQALLTLVRERALARLRIGVHLGDVMAAPNGDLLGHGINVAARLMQMAGPNAAVVSQAVQTQLRQAAAVQLRPPGRVQFDKMSERVEVFAIADKDTRFSRIAWRRSRAPYRAPWRGRSCNCRLLRLARDAAARNAAPRRAALRQSRRHRTLLLRGRRRRTDLRSIARSAFSLTLGVGTPPPR